TTLLQLLQQMPSAAALVSAAPATLKAVGARSALVEWLQVRGRARDQALADDLRWIEPDDHHFVPLGAPHYPPLLDDVPDAPVGLYVRGDPAMLSLPQLAMVGSRSPTPQGSDNASLFAAHLARCGLAITSGLAAG